MEPAQASVGRRIGGRFVLLRELGSGGAGNVYEALQEDLGRHVALKLLRPELASDPEVLARFRREARAAGALGHPHIAQVLDFAEPRGREPAYIAFELVKGTSLHDLLQREPVLSEARTIQLATQLLAGLEAAHAAGIVHRDLKPSNVFIADVQGLGEVAKILDFGIAQVHEGEAFRRLTSTGVIVGTPRYMSPEQISGRRVDARSDLWSVGVLLYRMLTGVLPFDGKPGEVLGAIRSQPVPPFPKEANVTPALEAIVQRALEKDPYARWQSAALMGQALRSLPPSSRRAAPAAPISMREQSTRPMPMREPATTGELARTTTPDAPRETQPGHPELAAPDESSPKRTESAWDSTTTPDAPPVSNARKRRVAYEVSPDATVIPQLGPKRSTIGILAFLVGAAAVALFAAYAAAPAEPAREAPREEATPPVIAPTPPAPTAVPDDEPPPAIPMRGTLDSYLREATRRVSEGGPASLVRVYAVGLDRESTVLDFSRATSARLELDFVRDGTCVRYLLESGETPAESIAPIPPCGEPLRPPLPRLTDVIAAGRRVCAGFGASGAITATLRAGEHGTRVSIADVSGRSSFTAMVDAWASVDVSRSSCTGSAPRPPAGDEGVINPWN